jgi:hypothetical protein
MVLIAALCLLSQESLRNPEVGDTRTYKTTAEYKLISRPSEVYEHQYQEKIKVLSKKNSEYELEIRKRAIGMKIDGMSIPFDDDNEDMVRTVQLKTGTMLAADEMVSTDAGTLLTDALTSICFMPEPAQKWSTEREIDNFGKLVWNFSAPVQQKTEKGTERIVKGEATFNGSPFAKSTVTYDKFGWPSKVKVEAKSPGVPLPGGDGSKHAFAFTRELVSN